MARKGKQSNKIVPEWSYPVDVDELEPSGLQVRISANEEERAQLALRLRVEALEALEADMRVTRPKGSVIVHVSGTFRADVLQSCVVSGEPVKSRIEEPLEAWFSDEGAAVSLAKAKQQKLIEKGQTEMPMIEEKDDPETIIDGQIDVGEVVTQHLSLAIDPYPHAEGVYYEHGDEDAEKQRLSFKNPFAALKEWKDKL